MGDKWQQGDGAKKVAIGLGSNFDLLWELGLTYKMEGSNSLNMSYGSNVIMADARSGPSNLKQPKSLAMTMKDRGLAQSNRWIGGDRWASFS